MGAQSFNFTLKFPQNGSFSAPNFIFKDIFDSPKFKGKRAGNSSACYGATQNKVDS